MRTLCCAWLVTLCHVSFAAADDRTKAVELLEAARNAVWSFDVTLNCSTRLFLDASRKKVVEVRGKKFTVPDVRLLPDSAATPKAQRFRQVYAQQGKYAPALRRVEELDAQADEPASVLAFDNTVLRTYYPVQASGMIDHPPDDPEVFVNRIVDYAFLVTLRTPGKMNLLSDLAAKLPREGVSVGADGELTRIEIPPENPERAHSAGYRVWLDPAHGGLLRRLHSYVFTPDQTGNRTEHLRETIEVTEYAQVDTGWAPVRAHLDQRIDRGELVDEISAASEIIVERDRSAWNRTFPSDWFAFDFPRGTIVTNRLTGVKLVVGDKNAGRNIDELMATAKEKMPLTMEARAAAGWGGTDLRAVEGQSLRSWLLALNGLVIVVLVGILVYRRRSAHRGG